MVLLRQVGRSQSRELPSDQLLDTIHDRVHIRREYACFQLRVQDLIPNSDLKSTRARCPLVAHHTGARNGSLNGPLQRIEAAIVTSVGTVLNVHAHPAS